MQQETTPGFKVVQSLILAILLTSAASLAAQPLEVTSGPPYTPENLITNIFLGDGVEVLNVTYQGVPQSVGFFNNGSGSIGMQRGILLTTGRAATQGAAIGVNSPGSAQASVPSSGNTVTDPDLQAIAGAGVGVNDICKYTITFRPYSDTLRFRYAFGSEEYPEYVCSDFNDIFGFFISGPGITGPYANNGRNIALVPGTNLPVRINNVNPGVAGANGTEINCRPPLGSLNYSGFYNNNENSNQMPVYDGYTDVFTAEAIVVPCSTYTIKLVICDVSDGAFDSGVFLEAKSFGTGSLDVQISGLNVDGGLAEGCRSGEIAFALPRPTEAPLTIDYTIGGTALNGVDYSPLPTQITIPAGDSIAVFTLEAIEDNLIEGDETIEIAVQLDPCTRDTFVILVKDNPLIKPDLGLDLQSCPDAPLQLDGAIPIVLPVPPRFANTNPLDIAQHNIQYTSSVNVQGVLPPVLGPDVIKAVCIDSLSHRWIDDLDIFLQGPDGQFIELTTDNGGNGGNGVQFDYYLGTCFTPGATTPINFPGPVAPPTAVPFRGDWAPEGVWSDLWDSGNRRTNGNWNLLVVDDAMNLTGTLYEWSICFNAPYEINYNWTPATGLSCTDCPNPMLTAPTTATTYIMVAEDSYGCQVSDTLLVEPLSSLAMSEVLCGQATETSVEFVWADVPGNLGYEVSIDGGPWMPASGALSHQVSSLSFLQEVNIAVRVIGSDCPSLPVSANCTSLNCTPPELTITTIEPVTCFAGSDGAISIGVNIGTGPFTFEIGGVQNTTGDFDGLVAGTYVARATDFFGCVGSLSFVMNEPPDPGFSFVVEQPISCNGAADGALTMAISDGTGPFVFDWTGGTADSIAVNLAAGTYSLTLGDANGCTYTLDTVLAEPELLVVTAQNNGVACFGENTGLAFAAVSGGTAPFDIRWNDPAIQLGDTAFALTAGTYEVLVTDANGCTAMAATQVAEPTELTAVGASRDANCAGAATGEVSITPSGGSPTYTYEWIDVNTQITVGTTNVVPALPAGEYRATVRDANGCELQQLLTIAEPPALNWQVALDSPICFGEANGQGEAIVQGGVMPYTYAWSNGAGTAQTSTLVAGPVALNVTDANGCTLDTLIQLTQPEVLTVALVTYDVRCAGGADGSASAQVAGGTAPYSFVWSQPGATDSLGNLSVGPISVQVTDANGCIATAAGQIGDFPALSLTLVPEEPACFGQANGQIQALAGGGAGGYTYLWNNGQQSATATGLAAGNHALTLTDANGCTLIENLTLGQPDLLSASTAVVPQGCNGPADGEAEVIALGGTMPYSYTWNNGQTTPQITGLVSGAYSVVVADANGCTANAQALVSGAPPVALAFTTTDALCFGQNSGAIQVQTTSGTAPFFYAWNNGLVPPVSNPANLPAGTYVVTVTDDNMCTATAAITINQPAQLLLDAAVVNVLCAGESSGSINLLPAGGIPPYSFLWSTGAITEDLTGISAGNYAVQVRDANGCLQNLAREVQQSAPLVLQSTVSDVDCHGASTGLIALQVQGGQRPYAFLWSNGSQNDSLLQAQAGDYEVTLTDAYGCTAKEIVTVEEPAALVTTISATDITCFGEKDGRIDVATEGGTPPYRYRISSGSFFSGSPAFIALLAGNYQVLVRDANGCEITTSSVEVVEPPLLTVTLPERVEIRYGDSLQLEPLVEGALPVSGYTWIAVDSTTLSCLSCPSPWASPLYETDYLLLVENENGCEAEALVRVVVRKDFPVLAPTGFTPNGDGENDLLLVHGLPGIRVLTFRIFDRWGELIFQRDDFDVNDENAGWDGAYRGKPLNGGVFIWQVDALMPDGRTERFTGQTTLLR